jgi:hypothetical protein
VSLVAITIIVMTEYRILSFMQPTTALLGEVPGGVKSSTLDLASSVPELAEHLDGWDVINSQIIPAGEFSYLVLTLRTSVGPIEVPTID